MAMLIGTPEEVTIWNVDTTGAVCLTPTTFLTEAAFFTEAAFLRGTVLLGGMDLPKEGWTTIKPHLPPLAQSEMEVDPPL